MMRRVTDTQKKGEEEENQSLTLSTSEKDKWIEEKYALYLTFSSSSISSYSIRQMSNGTIIIIIK